MNSGFSPAVINPSGFKIQRQSQQMPFFFGGSQVPLHLGMRGSGMTSSKVKPEPSKPKEPVSAETQALRDYIKMMNKKKKDFMEEMIAIKQKKIKNKDYSEGSGMRMYGSGLRGGMIVEAEDDEFDTDDERELENDEFNELADMIERTQELLLDARSIPEQPRAIYNNIQTKLSRWNGRNGIWDRLVAIMNDNEANPITLGFKNQVMDYLRNFTQRPIQPFQAPTFF